MDTTYTKLDLGYLIDSDWSAIEDYFRIDDSGIWLLEESAPELRWLTQDERDLFMIHPDANPNFPVLPFPFTMKQFLKFADLPATELHDSYLFADDTVDVVAIERLERMYAPSGALARALMFGELPKLAQLKKIQGEAASAYAAPVMTVGVSGGVNWTLKKPQRFQGYSKPLYDLLKAAHIAGQPSPKAREVLDKWKGNPPPDVATVTDNGLKYYDAKGNTKPADLDAIRKAIDRMIR